MARCDFVVFLGSWLPGYLFLLSCRCSLTPNCQDAFLLSCSTYPESCWTEFLAFCGFTVCWLWCLQTPPHTYNLLFIAFVMLRCGPSIPALFRNFIMQRCWALLKVLSVSVDHVISVLSLLNMQNVTTLLIYLHWNNIGSLEWCQLGYSIWMLYCVFGFGFWIFIEGVLSIFWSKKLVTMWAFGIELK